MSTIGQVGVLIAGLGLALVGYRSALCQPLIRLQTASLLTVVFALLLLVDPDPTKLTANIALGASTIGIVFVLLELAVFWPNLIGGDWAKDPKIARLRSTLLFASPVRRIFGAKTPSSTVILSHSARAVRPRWVSRTGQASGPRAPNPDGDDLADVVSVPNVLVQPCGSNVMGFFITFSSPAPLLLYLSLRRILMLHQWDLDDCIDAQREIELLPAPLQWAVCTCLWGNETPEVLASVVDGFDAALERVLEHLRPEPTRTRPEYYQFEGRWRSSG